MYYGYASYSCAYGYSGYDYDVYGGYGNYGVSANYYYGYNLYGQIIKETGPGYYGPSGHAQYFGGQGQYGYAYYEMNPNGTLTYFGYGVRNGYAMIYGSYYSYT